MTTDEVKEEYDKICKVSRMQIKHSLDNMSNRGYLDSAWVPNKGKIYCINVYGIGMNAKKHVVTPEMDAMLEVFKEKPLTFDEICDEYPSISFGVLEKKIKILEKTGLLEEKDDKTFGLTGKSWHTDPDCKYCVLFLLAEGSPMSISDMTDVLKMNRRSVQRRIGSLLKDGCIKTSKIKQNGRSVSIYSLSMEEEDDERERTRQHRA